VEVCWGREEMDLQQEALEDAEEDDATLEACCDASQKEALGPGEFFHRVERSSVVCEVCEAWGWGWLNVCSDFFCC